MTAADPLQPFETRHFTAGGNLHSHGSIEEQLLSDGGLGLMTRENPNLIRAKDIVEAEESARHPLNENSQVIGTHMSGLTGLSRVGVSIVRIPVGKESFAYHSHYCEEEWLYILSGVGIAEIDGEEHDVAAGDFMGFPTPSVAHHLRNSGDEELVYLMGGESRAVEVADFPRHGKRMVRRGPVVELFDFSAAESFAAQDED